MTATIAAGRRLGEAAEAILLAAVRMGASDDAAARIVCRRLELLLRAPLTKSYRRDVMRVYSRRAAQMREGILIPTERRARA